MKRRVLVVLTAMLVTFGLIGLVGCSNTAPTTSSGTASGSGASAGDLAQSPAASTAGESIVSSKAVWEKVATVPDSGLIEGMNVKDGVLWFIDVAKSRISKVVDGEAVTVYEDPSKTAMPNGAKFIDDTTMLITDRSQGLCTFNINTLEYKVLFSEYNGTHFLGLNDLVLDGAGGAYFTDPGQSDYLTHNGSVYYYNYQNNTPVELVSGGFAYPNGITISPDGLFLYVAEFNTNSIICVPSKTYTAGRDTPYVFARLSGGHGPDGVLTDADGNIYVAHLNAGEVVIVAANGFELAAVRLPASGGALVSNVLIDTGYLYVTDFQNGIIWRIPCNATANPLA